MILEWFSDGLKTSGHVRLSNEGIATTGRFWREAALLEKLRAKDFVHIVRLNMHDQAFRNSEILMNQLNDQGLELGPWTSFRFEDTVFFVFKRLESAMLVRMMFPD